MVLGETTTFNQRGVPRESSERVSDHEPAESPKNHAKFGEQPSPPEGPTRLHCIDFLGRKRPEINPRPPFAHDFSSRFLRGGEPKRPVDRRTRGGSPVTRRTALKPLAQEPLSEGGVGLQLTVGFASTTHPARPKEILQVCCSVYGNVVP